MRFMLCVTPVVSSQMQLCSPLAIQTLFHGETNAGNFGGVVWMAKKLVLAGTNYKPELNISVPTPLLVSLHYLVTWCRHTYQSP